MPLLDTRPGKLDIHVRAGNELTLTLIWPASLAGRTFTAEVDGTYTAPVTGDLDVTIVGAVMTIIFPAALTAVMSGRAKWTLTETTSGEQVRMLGRMLPSRQGTDTADESVTVSVDEIAVTVNVLGEPGPPGSTGSGATAEEIMDVVGAAITAGARISVTYNDPAGTVTIAVTGLVSTDLSDFAEAVRDRLGSTLVSGAGIAIVVDDPGDTVTITAEVTQAELDTLAGRVTALEALDVIVEGDARLTNARTPTTHATSHQDGGTDELALDGSQITTGTVADARIASTIARDSEVSAAVAVEATARAAADALLIPLTQKAAANGVATLGADSKIPSAQLPPIAITNVYTVASQAAMLALTAERGDVALRTDLDPDGFFILTTDSPGTLADWVQITAPGAVTSVDGQTGTVSLAAVYDAIGAAAAAQAAAVQRANHTGTQTASTISDLAEAVQDIVGAAITAGARISVTYNDPAGTITIAVTGLVSTDLSDFTEAVQDVAGGMATDSGTIDFTYDDTAGTLTAVVKNASITTAMLAFDVATQAELDAAIAALSATYQPLDSDLTAIAALSTTAYGRAFLELANAGAGRTALGLGTAAVAATGDFDAAGAAAAAQAASQPLDSDLTAIAALTTTAFGRSVLDRADAAALRTLAGVVIGTDVEAHDADLTTIAGLTPTNDDLLQRKAGAWTNRTPAQVKTDLAIAEADVSGLVADLALKAPLVSPTLTGTPAAPTAAQGTNTTQLATTAYVQTEAGLLIPKSLVDAKGDLLVGTADNTVARKAVGSNGQAIIADSAQSDGLKWVSLDRTIRVVIDGGGSALTTGAKKVYVSVPFDCTITKARLLADVSGSVVLDVWKDTYANFPPTVADTITASAKPTLSSALKSEDSTLTGWTTSLSAGDIIEVNVDSATTVTKVYLDLFVRPR